MPRRYIKVKQYEEQVFKLKEQGLTNQEIAEKLNIDREQLKNLITRHNQNQKKLASWNTPKRKGRPPKSDEDIPESIQKLDKITQLKYELARKEARIKSLEAENELMRDFLSLTEGK